MATSKEVTAQEAIIDEVKRSVLEAAAKLSSFGAEFERVAWVLEDALGLLEEQDEQTGVPDISELLAFDEAHHFTVRAANS